MILTVEGFLRINFEAWRTVTADARRHAGRARIDKLEAEVPKRRFRFVAQLFRLQSASLIRFLGGDLA